MSNGESFIEPHQNYFSVGFRYSDGDIGAAAQVSTDKDWLHIITDSDEGHAMLNIECLPHLIKALQDLYAKQHPRASEPRQCLFLDGVVIDGFLVVDP